MEGRGRRRERGEPPIDYTVLQVQVEEKEEEARRVAEEKEKLKHKLEKAERRLSQSNEAFDKMKKENRRTTLAGEELAAQVLEATHNFFPHPVKAHTNLFKA